MFEDRWAQLAKKKLGWATKDNDEHNNGASIVPTGDNAFYVSVWRYVDPYGTISFASDLMNFPATLDAGKVLAEKFIETLNKVEV